MDRIVALYWDNIDPRVVKAQRDVFAHFGYSVDQRERTASTTPISSTPIWPSLRPMMSPC